MAAQDRPGRAHEHPPATAPDPLLVARSEPRVAAKHRGTQVRLHSPGGRYRACEAVRVRGRRAACDVDDPQEVTAVRIPDRRRSANPSVHNLVEVLGRENLYGMLRGESGTDRVGPGVSLAPGGAL